MAKMYNPSEIEKKWQEYWAKNETSRLMCGIFPSQSIMHLTCSHTHPALAYMQVIRRAIQQPISCPE